MSSIKDIMDVDVEPLESQAYRRSREAAQQQSLPYLSIATSPELPSPAPTTTATTIAEESKDSAKANVPIKRRRTNEASDAPPSDCVVKEGMEYQTGFSGGGLSQQSGMETRRLFSRGTAPAATLPVKYTPVTGRISRAKKGVPVHTCDICRPVKTFTRAEHLRRHQLSHQNPAYPCTFEDCERAFHRADLLARHVHKHESQGEKPYKSGDRRSRTASIASDIIATSSNVVVPLQQPLQEESENNPVEAETIQLPNLNSDRMVQSMNFASNVSSYTSGNYSNNGNSHKRPRTLSDTRPSPRSSTSRSGSGQFDRPSPTNFVGPHSHSRFDQLYSATSTTDYSYPVTPQLHLLQIPEEPLMPGLSYTHENSPWCSPASSNCSTQSDGGNSASYWTPSEGRHASTVAMSEWPAPVGIPQWSHGMANTPRDGRGPVFTGLHLDQFNNVPYDTSPRLTPSRPAGSLLDVTSSVEFYDMGTAVGTPTLSTFGKPFTQPFSASSPRFTASRMENDGGKKSLVEPLPIGTSNTDTVITYPLRHPKDLNIYLDLYFQYFHQCFPIIHSPTFVQEQDCLLTCAMAAIGTQYHNTAEARARGSELNEACKKNIELHPNWTTQTMQAILLTEFFTRFRARKTNVRLSRHFEELYNRLLNYPRTKQVEDTISSQGNTQDEPTIEWYQWIDNEARQRLLATCFMFDIHQSIYHEQARSKARRDDLNNELILPCPELLWGASNALEWHAQQCSHSNEFLHVAEEEISPRGVLDTSPFTQRLLVCSFAARLPKRQDPSRPNDFLPSAPDMSIENLMRYFPTSPLAHVYLAIYHTPLQDLLAISGDTWVFSQKITPPSAFHAAQSRLRIWSTSLAAAQAVHHSCRILSSAFSIDYGDSTCSTFEELKLRTLCICDYWSLYISALICWAFGNRYQSVSSVSAHGTYIDDQLTASTADPRAMALSYVERMLALGIDELLTSKAYHRGDTAGVIVAVRQRLEVESVGSKSSLLVDAIGVLHKITASGKGKWF